MLPSGPDKSIVVADKIVARLREEIKKAERSQVVTGKLPSFERDVRFPGLSTMRISDLLTPESGAWLPGSEEAEQMKALTILLGDSISLFNLTPRRLSGALRARPVDGGYMDIRSRGDYAYVLRLPTTVENPETGERLYYTLKAEMISGKRRVRVSQRLHSLNVSEIF